MKTEIKYISKEFAGLQRKVIYHTWHFNFSAVFLQRVEFSAY